jgi:hypothetical protein
VEAPCGRSGVVIGFLWLDEMGLGLDLEGVGRAGNGIII